jgi:WD40 repeat protein/energy-coupling factor transporter ATP-binding protein EcfA2
VPEPEAEVAFNPFPGLRPFEPDEDYLFFGRETQTDELLRKLRTTRFLSILGSSGSGKSSLVRSGLIPTLYGGGMTRAGSRWRVAIMRPGEDPLGNLAAALSMPDALGGEGAEEGLTRAFFETTLRASQLGLVECIRQSRIPHRDNVLVLVDQFEELFRYKRSRRVVGRDEAVAFVKLLLTARESDLPCYIAVTMRSDFIGDCMEFGQLPEVINDGIYLVPRMTRDELRSAITGPVAVGGALIAPRLVSRLLNDVGDDPDQLPILQHALMRTWANWEHDQNPGEGLDLRHYEAIGTMHTALSRHAEESYGELDSRGQGIAEKLFKALTDKGSDLRGVRRPAPLSEICALAQASVDDVIAVVERFRKPGRSFLMPPVGVPLRENSILDISHESLMRVWNRLSGWAIDEARSGQLYLNVARAAQRHEEGVAALWRDPELQLALTWRENERPTEQWASRYDSSFARAMTFLDDSRIDRDREIRDKEARRRRELRLARALVVILSTASLLMLALGAYAWTQKDEAVLAQRAAVRERGLAIDAQHRAENALDQVRIEQTRTESAKRHAEQQRAFAEQERLKAEHQTQVATEQTAIATSARLQAETERLNAERNEREAREQKTVAVQASRQAEEEKTKAEQSESQTRRLSHLAAARALALTIPKQSDRPEESALLALEVNELNRGNDGNAQDADIFNAMRTALDRLKPLPAVRGLYDSVRALVVTPDGHTAVLGSEDGRVVRVPLDDHGQSGVLGTFTTPVRAIALRRAGDLVAAAGGGQLRFYDLRKPAAAPREVADGIGTVTALAFDTTGAHLAAGTLEGRVKLLDVARNSTPVDLQVPANSRVTAVAFSPDGTTLGAALAAKGGALLWNVANSATAPRAVCQGEDVRSIAFSPDSRSVACGSARGPILRVALDGGGAPPVPLAGHRSSVNSLAYDRSGSFLASASSDGTIRIWNLKQPQSQPILLTGHESWVWAVAFSPAGDRLISGGQDRTVRTWPARTEVLAETLCSAVNGRAGLKQLTREAWGKYMPSDVAYRDGAPCVARSQR